MSSLIDRALEVATLAARDAGAAALAHWRVGVKVEHKSDESPVTIADREAEAAILRAIRDVFPTHSILAEESGTHRADADHRWIVDPLDGTQGFTRGGTHWGPLVAFEIDGEIVAGAMAMPALSLTYTAARGRGCFRNGEPLRLSDTTAWNRATLSVGQLPGLLAPPHGDRVLGLIRTAASTRCYGDVASAAEVLEGRADVWIEAGVKPWDLAPFAILFEEAGGHFTNFAGTRSLDVGSAIGANAALHAHVLGAVAG